MTPHGGTSLEILPGRLCGLVARALCVPDPLPTRSGCQSLQPPHAFGKFS